MLARSDTSIGECLAILGKHGLHGSPLVPTRTGLGKSIMDAIEPLRAYLKRHGIHDYEGQAKGEDSKRLVEASFIGVERETKTVASLYRPESKNGDPRIWFRKLPSYTEPHNLLVIVAHEGRLYVINCSNKAILESIANKGSPLARLADAMAGSISTAAAELLDMLRDISRRGFIASVRGGDTGIGMTLENLLGIRPNADRAPDYKGIELKASRRRPRADNRVNLFSQVPNWEISNLGSGIELLRAYGYQREGRLQLYCTVSAARPNSQGLFFVVSEDEDLLRNRAAKGDPIFEVACWKLQKLRERLLEKHQETMWIKADVNIDASGRESFHFNRVTHTRGPFVGNLEALLSDSTITMDYTLSERRLGVARDHGYLFKIRPDRIPALFPPPREYDLRS